ncbi:MAG: triose-phosphate isomerase [Candidatus Helarchaeota archaeon]
MGNLKTPIILLNYKTYSQAIGENAVKISKIVDNIINKKKVNIIIAPQFADIYRIGKETRVPIYSQHIDPITPGSHTGHILPESVKDAGAVGTLLNHSERQISEEIIKKSIDFAKKIGLKTCVCAPSPEKSAILAKFNPDYIAFELPELIGSGVSISTTEPKLVKSSVKMILDANPNVIPLCGAGISTGEDVYSALKLGTKGVLLASAFVKATDPKEKLKELVDGVLRFQKKL